jgi:SAM-dependent methyltransferase
MTLIITPRDRAAHYAATFPSFPPLRADDRWIDGSWVLGNNYATYNAVYGSYPPAYLKRVAALFPELSHTPRPRVLHLFSGSLTPEATIPGVRVDLRPSMTPDVVGDAHALPFMTAAFDLVLADPPYSDADAVRYDTPMPSRLKVMREAARVLKPGGHLVWLDCTMPQFSKALFQWYGAIGIWRSTNHRIRGCMLFQRV